MDPDWVTRIRRFEQILSLIRAHSAELDLRANPDALAQALRLTSEEQGQYRELVREASVPTDLAPTVGRTPFLRPNEQRMLFLACDYTVWGGETFVLRSLWRQAFIELRDLRSLPLHDRQPFAYAASIRAELHRSAPAHAG